MNKPPEYITGTYRFLERDFFIDERAYIPNKETEILTTYAISLIKPEQTILDIGVGSGNIAISLSLAQPACKIYGIDVSPEALEVAVKNVDLHNVTNVTLMKSRYVDDIDISSPDLIIADLPWGDEEHILETSNHEYHPYLPKIALFHPEGILSAYLELIESIQRKHWKTTLLFESGTISKEEIASEMPKDLEWEYIPFPKYSITKVVF